MPISRHNREAGFTLVEVLVALAIIAVALMAAVRAAGLGTSNMYELRLRLFAGWVAENVLAEQRARGEWLPLGTYHGSAQQGGIGFTWREKISSTPNIGFRRVDIFVYAAPKESHSTESHSLAYLTGFLTQPSETVKPESDG
jgi:general secretion pathway protein I